MSLRGLGPKSMHSTSELHAKAVLRCIFTSASMLSSVNVARRVGLHSPYERTPLMILSAVARTRRWGHLSSSFSSLMRSISVLCF